MWSWIFLLLSISFELAGSTCLKLSNGLTRVLPSIGLFIFYGFCLYFLGLALQGIDLSIAYAVWAGLGTTAVVIISIIKFKESICIKAIQSIALIVVGVILLELF